MERIMSILDDLLPTLEGSNFPGLSSYLILPTTFPQIEVVENQISLPH